MRAGEASDPEPREDDVLVQIHAAGVNALDFKLRNGEFKQIFFEDIFADWGFWNVMRGFADGDAYVALPGPFRWLDEVYAFVIGALARLVHPRAGEPPKSVPPFTVGDGKKEL